MTITSVPLALTGTCVALLAAHLLYKHLRLQRLSYSGGCSPPAEFPRPFWDFYGVSTFLALGNAFKAHRYFEAVQETYASVGETTFTSKVLGSTIICTIDPKNLQNVFSTNAKNWGVSMRRDGFDGYIGRGFLTTDGTEHEKWKEFVKPSFSREIAWDHKAYERHFGAMLAKIPRDGSTVDLQELLKVLVS